MNSEGMVSGGLWVYPGKTESSMCKQCVPGLSLGGEARGRG